MVVEGGRGDDARQPRVERLEIAELPDLGPRPQVRVLNHVLSGVVADQAARRGQQPRFQFDEAFVEKPIGGAGDWYRDGFAHSTFNCRDHCIDRTPGIVAVLHRLSTRR